MSLALFFSDFYRSFVLHKFLYGTFVIFRDNTDGRIGWDTSERKEKIEKKHSNIVYKQECFRLLNSEHHGNKYYINKGVYEHKATAPS